MSYIQGRFVQQFYLKVVSTLGHYQTNLTFISYIYPTLFALKYARLYTKSNKVLFCSIENQIPNVISAQLLTLISDIFKLYIYSGALPYIVLPLTWYAAIPIRPINALKIISSNAKPIIAQVRKINKQSVSHTMKFSTPNGNCLKSSN